MEDTTKQKLATPFLGWTSDKDILNQQREYWGAMNGIADLRLVNAELLEALEKLYLAVYGGNSHSLEDCLYRSVKSDEFEQSIVAAIKKAKGL